MFTLFMCFIAVCVLSLLLTAGLKIAITQVPAESLNADNMDRMIRRHVMFGAIVSLIWAVGVIGTLVTGFFLLLGAVAPAAAGALLM